MRNARDPHSQLLPPKPPGRRWTLVLFVVVALVLHAPFMAIPATWLFSEIKPQKAKKRVVYIHRTSRVRKRRIRKRRQKLRKRRQAVRFKRPTPPRKKKKKKKPKPKRIPGQIVDVAPTPDDRPPPDTRFLSEYNTRVKKQTVSRHRKLKYKRATAKPQRIKRPNPRRRALVASRIQAPRSRFKRLRLTAPVPKRQKTTRKAKKNKPKKRARKKVVKPKMRKRRRVAVTKHKQGKAAPKKQPKNQRGRRKTFSLNIGPLKLDPSLKPIYRQGPGPMIPPKKAIDLRPNFGTLSRISGNPAPDHIKGVKEGAATLLNSRRYVYASFFNRVKQQVAQHWNPNQTYRRRDPFGNVFGVKDRSTTVAVELYKNGKIAKITVAQSCGLTFLDSEAVRAFRAAQPFPNPPKGLLERDGRIRFKFSFFLQISSRTGFRLFR